MRFVSITLDGFKRLGFGTISHFELTPVHFCQLILGINGFGKSMLLKEISPLPGNKNDYFENGKKIIVINHLGKEYKLTSEYGSSVKCSFIDMSNEEELNPGHTQSVQAQLAQQYFGYTTDIHHLLHGREAFTEMSPKRRREWFISVSNIDYDYAISLWNSVRDYLRDVSGSIKQLKKRLVEETESVLTDVEKSLIKKEIDLIDKRINAHYELIDRPRSTDSARTKSELDNLKDSINTKYKYLYSCLKNLTNSKWRGYSLDELKDLSSKYSSDIGGFSSRLSIYTEEIEKEKRLYRETLNNTNLKETLLKERKSLLPLVNIVSDHLASKESSINTLIEALRELELLHSSYPSALESTPPSSQRESDLTNELNTLTHSKETLSSKLASISAELNILNNRKQAHLVKCPDCNHEFIPGYTEAEHKHLLFSKSNLEKEYSQLESSISKVKTDLESITSVNEFIRKYKAFINYYSKDLPETLLTADIDTLRFKFNTLIESLKGYVEQIKSSIEVTKARNRLKEIDSTIESLKHAKFYTKDEFNKLLEEKEKRISQVIKDLNNLRELNSSLVDYITLRENKLVKIKSELEKDLNLLTEKEDEYIKQYVSHFLNKKIEEFKISQAEYIKKQREAESKDSVITFIESQIKQLEEKEVILKLIVDELSPQKGLIAEGLLSFINSFLTYMNALIKQIWSYPLILSLPENALDDLSFKFPMSVGSRLEEIPDIALGSSGIKEVVNLAFKLTAMKSLNLDEYPLFLDEFGASFDQQHRINAVNVIKNIIDEKIHSQLFMVSHYESSYGGLTNIDVCLLNPEIEIAFNEFNQHVSIQVKK